jgi:exodeoxyribonuclease VII large subunit
MDGRDGAPLPTAESLAPGTFGVRILGVSEVARAIKAAVREDPRLTDLWVEGEIGRVTVSSAGHAYFALKDERSQLQCVWFRDDRLRSAFEAQVGLRVVVHGRVDLFEPQGALQLYVESLQPAGFGDLALQFEELKARLAAEGLFESERKRKLPTRPTAIAVITSPTGAVWKDIATVLGRRWPLVRVVLVAAQVQGADAPASIVSAFRRLERHREDLVQAGRAGDAPQVTILARGGGSLEDLWSFNDERVVRAVVGHPIPVVTGVGHEVDVTLADFAADVRAPTPSAAAEIVVPDRAEMSAALRRAGTRLAAVSAGRLAVARNELNVERRALEVVSPSARLVAAREQVGLLFDRATRALAVRLGQDRARLDRAAATLPRLTAATLAAARADLEASAAALAVLGPQATLDRGYAIVRRRADGAVVREPADAPARTGLDIRVADGTVAATVDEDAAG